MDTVLDVLKISSDEVFHKPGEFLGNENADAGSQWKDHKIWNKNLLKKQLFHKKKEKKY